MHKAASSACKQRMHKAEAAARTQEAASKLNSHECLSHLTTTFSYGSGPQRLCVMLDTGREAFYMLVRVCV